MKVKRRKKARPLWNAGRSLGETSNDELEGMLIEIKKSLKKHKSKSEEDVVARSQYHRTRKIIRNELAARAKRVAGMIFASNNIWNAPPFATKHARNAQPTYWRGRTDKQKDDDGLFQTVVVGPVTGGALTRCSEEMQQAREAGNDPSHFAIYAGGADLDARQGD